MAICGGSWCRCGRFRDNDRDSGGICKKGWHECEILCRWLWKYIFSFFFYFGVEVFFFLLIFCIKGFLGKKMICSLSFFFANLYFIYKSWFWPLLFGANEFVDIFFHSQNSIFTCCENLVNMICAINIIFHRLLFNSWNEHEH